MSTRSSARFLHRQPDAVRRKDREVEDDEWIRTFLEQEPVGTLATEFEGRPFINSNLFVYDREEDCIYVHTAHAGRTRSNSEMNPRVCFHVFSMGRLLPAAEALEFSVEYEGVTVFGDIRILDDREESRRALQQLLDKYFTHLTPGRDYRPITLDEIDRTTVFRIDVDCWSGKRKAVDADFAGAFLFAPRP